MVFVGSRARCCAARRVVTYEAPAFYYAARRRGVRLRGVAWVGLLIGRARPAAPVRVAAEQMTVEAQKCAQNHAARIAAGAPAAQPPALTTPTSLQRLRQLARRARRRRPPLARARRVASSRKFSLRPVRRPARDRAPSAATTAAPPWLRERGCPCLTARTSTAGGCTRSGSRRSARSRSTSRAATRC